MPPVIDRSPAGMMGSIDDPAVLAHELTLGGDHDPIGVNPQADRAVGERCRHAVARTLEVHEAGWRYPLGVLDEAVERPTRRHQTGELGGVDIGDGAGQHAVLDLRPLRYGEREKGSTRDITLEWECRTKKLTSDAACP